jgi:hypothetical protein
MGFLTTYLIYKITGKPEYVLAYIFLPFLILGNFYLVGTINSMSVVNILIIIIDIILISYLIHIFFKRRKSKQKVSRL